MPSTPGEKPTLAARIGVVALFVAGVTGLAHLLGAGGYPSGEVLVALTCGLSAGVLAYAILGTATGRVLWSIFALLVGLIAGAQVAAVAPIGHARLEAIIDGDTFPEAASSERSGNLRCSPTCPAVTRTYLIAGTPDVAAFTVLTALLQQGFTTDAAIARGTLVARTDEAIAEITAVRRGRTDPTTVTLELRSIRR